jgi:hypothetical protein
MMKSSDFSFPCSIERVQDFFGKSGVVEIAILSNKKTRKIIVIQALWNLFEKLIKVVSPGIRFQFPDFLLMIDSDTSSVFWMEWYKGRKSQNLRTIKIGNALYVMFLSTRTFCGFYFFYSSHHPLQQPPSPTSPSSADSLSLSLSLSLSQSNKKTFLPKNTNVIYAQCSENLSKNGTNSKFWRISSISLPSLPPISTSINSSIPTHSSLEKARHLQKNRAVKKFSLNLFKFNWCELSCNLELKLKNWIFWSESYFEIRIWEPIVQIGKQKSRFC